MAKKRTSRSRPSNKKCCWPLGYVLATVGFGLIVANATAYLTRCGKVPAGVAIIGLALVVIGALLESKNK
jgi:hypothetical protein